jgi:hypothetical protein
MGSKWTEQARQFMQTTIRGGGRRHVGSSSKLHGIAFSLCHDHGMLEMTRYYRAGKQGVAVYQVTDKGKQTFGEVV